MKVIHAFYQTAKLTPQNGEFIIHAYPVATEKYNPYDSLNSHTNPHFVGV